MRRHTLALVDSFFIAPVALAAASPASGELRSTGFGQPPMPHVSEPTARLATCETTKGKLTDAVLPRKGHSSE
jgi:hypothetical protein